MTPASVGRVGQLVHLDFDGARAVTYDGPVRVGPTDVPAFSAAPGGQAGREGEVIAATAAALNRQFAGTGVHFTTAVPPGAEHVTVYVGGTGVAFAAYGSFYGLAEAVDHGNRVQADKAFVFSDALRPARPTVRAYAAALAEVIGHEVGHLLGEHHDHGHPASGPLDAVAYAQGASNPVHQHLSREGFRLFTDQFKPGDLTSAQENNFVRGAFEEDEDGRNPWGEGSRVGAVNSPSLRHFWAHDAFFGRGPTAGLLGYDSAPNRSYKYFTGGFGFEGRDGVWGNGQGAVPGRGIVAAYRAGDKRLAFEYLGHVAHLLQDMTVPVHAHADQHLELDGIGIDPDPFHDWVDGIAFSSSLINNPRRIASFNEDAAPRWRTYGAVPLSQSRDLRRPQTLGQITPGRGSVVSVVDPLYGLFLETAGAADDYDTKGYLGQADRGGRGFHEEPELDRFGLPTGREILVSSYRDFDPRELDTMARFLVPRAVTATAELLRYFYATLDGEGPVVRLPRFCSTDPNNPQVISNPRLELRAVASDEIMPDPTRPGKFTASQVNSGVGKDLFKFEYTEYVPGMSLSWRGTLQGSGSHSVGTPGDGDPFVGKQIATSTAVLPGQTGKMYAIRVTVEDGAGNEGQSQVYYVRVGQQPATALVTVIDVSGSMAGSPLAAAKAGARSQIGLLNDHDRGGVVSFSSTAGVVHNLTLIQPGSNVREQMQAAIDALADGGTTSIGAGLLMAAEMLGGTPTATTPADCTCYRVIVLLSDGQENTAPYVADVLGSIDPSIVIHTVGLGSGADSQGLQDLASSRGGSFQFARDERDLRDIYVRLAGAAGDEQDTMRQRGTIAQGQQTTRHFTVDGTAQQLTVGLQWPGSDLDLTLVAPDGTTFSRQSPGPRARFLGGPDEEYFKIDAPQAGTWQAVITGVQTDPGGEPFEVFARVASPLKGLIVSEFDNLMVGDRVFLLVRLSEGAGVTGATVRGRVRRIDAPSGGRSLLFFDDGQHGDGAADDGLYGAEFVAGRAGGGGYELHVQAEGRTADGRAFVRAPSRTFFVTGSGPVESPNVGFVVGLYHTLLGRDAEPAGLDRWVQELEAGTSRDAVAAAVYKSAEHRNIQVTGYYRKYLRRDPDATGREQWVNKLLAGTGEDVVILGFLMSSEFQSDHTAGRDYITGLYTHLLGRTPDVAGFDLWESILTSNQDRAEVAYHFLRSREYLLRAVDGFYATYLSRNPDTGGRDAWLDVLTRGQSSAAVAMTFLASEEYFAGNAS